MDEAVARPETGRSGGRGTRAKWRDIVAWCAYDWGSSAPPAIIISFVFATYFTEVIAPDSTTGTAMWGNMMSASGVAIALLSLVLGPVADQGAGRKTWLGLFTGIAVLAGALLWFVVPGPSWLLGALALCFAVNVGLEVSMVFYNAMLTDVAPPHMVGRVSGWGWGIGYIGAIVCLVLALALIQTEPPPFGLDDSTYEPVRASSVLAAAWMLLFALPLFLSVREPRRQVGVFAAAAAGVRQVRHTIGLLRGHRDATRFLIAHLLYRDGLNTLFIFGGIYAAGTFDMSTEEILTFGVGLYVVSGIGAFGFAWIDDRIGGRRTVLLSVAGLVGCGIPLLIVQSKTGFFIAGLAIGLFFGPVQSASRSLMARLTPEGLEGQMFGLFGLSGKAISPFGPLIVGWVTLAADSQRIGMATILLFLIAGGVLLWGVREPEKRPKSLNPHRMEAT